MVEIEKIGVVILAAGASTRFGSPKQLAKFQGDTLIKRIAETVISTNFKTVVVLGSKASEIRKEIETLPLEIVVNESWQSGLSSSIKVGLEKLCETAPDISAAILLLCDQPFITKETLLGLVEKQQETRKSIVASAYSQTVGTPALFTKDMFPELLEIDSKKGAKSLIQKYSESKLAVSQAPEAALDIDVPQDLERL